MAFSITVGKAAVAAAALALTLASPVQAQTTQTTAFTQALAAAASLDDAVAAFYRTQGYSTLWTGP